MTFNFSLYLAFMILLVSSLLLISDLRRKFIFFILSVLLFSIFGFLFDLDGIFLIFLTTEFTIFMLFLMTYTQLYGNYTFIKSPYNYKLLLPFIIIIFNLTPINNFYLFISYYKSLDNLVSSDFYILYQFLFSEQFLVTLLVILIISFFSLFFIIMYFSLKLVKTYLTKAYKYIYILRKQYMLKQAVFLTRLYVFQN